MGGRGAESNKKRYPDTDSFFGNVRKVSTKYIEPEKQVLDDDTVIVYTNNVTAVKGNPVLIIGNNQAVYLKDKDFTLVTREVDGTSSETVAVKIHRGFKPYTFRSNISDEISIDQPYSFEDFRKMAQEQQKKRGRVKPQSAYIYNRYIANKKDRKFGV